MKEDRFNSLVQKAASLFESVDPNLTVCLLDKIGKHKAVLEKLVEI
jgi:hypothetical protein